MADDTRNDRGARKGSKGDDRGPRTPAALLRSKAEAFIFGVLEETPTDTFGERLADSAVRNQAQKAGGAFAEYLLARPVARKVLLLIPDGVAEYLGPVAASYAMDRWVPETERTKEWAKEFAQGFGARLAAEGKTPAADGAAPAKPAGPREMSAAEVLAKKPALVQYVERTYTLPDEAARVMDRLHAHLNFEFEADMLLIADGAATAPFDALTGPTQTQVLDAVARLFEPNDRPRITAELRKRVGGLPDLGGLLVAPAAPAAAPVDLSAAFTGHGDVLTAVTALIPDTGARAAILTRLAPHLADASRKAFLFAAPSGDEAVPGAVAADPSWQQLLTDVARLIADADRPRVLADIGKRVRDVSDIARLRAPAPGGLTAVELETRILALPVRMPALSRTMLEERLATVEALPAAPAVAPALTRELFETRLMALPERAAPPVGREAFERRLKLIEDGRADRLLGGGFKAAIDRANAVGRSLFGSTDQVGAFMDDGAAFFGDLEESFFGPDMAAAPQGPPPPPTPGIFARMFAGIGRFFGRGQANAPVNTTPPQNPGGTP